MIRRLALGLVLLASAVVAVPADAGAPRVRLVGKVATGRSVVVEGSNAGRAVPVVALPAWTAIDDLQVSPSNHYAFLFAQLAPNTSRTAFVIDLVQGKVAGTYRPGFGGTFLFAANDDVVQIWGCGTACANLEIREPSGKSLGAYFCDGFDESAEISPDRRHAACFHREALDIVDLTTGRPTIETKTPCTTLGQRDAFHWEGPESAQFRCYDDEAGDAVDVVVGWAGGHATTTKRAVQAP